MTVDPQSLKALSLERLTTGSGNDTGVVLSRDGKYAAFATEAESHRMWLFPLDAAAGRITGDGRPVTAATTNVVSATLTPDGQRMAYSQDNVGSGTGGFWIEDLLTGNRRQVAGAGQLYREVPRWSPDGSRLAYVWERDTAAGQQRTIAVRPAAGGDEQLLADPLNTNDNVLPFGWSPDGQSLLVSSSLSTGGRWTAVALWPLAAAPHADRAERVLASNPDYDLWQESFSPSGRWVVFVGTRTSTSEPDATATLYVISSAAAPATQWTRLTDPHDWADKPRWSPDGKLLVLLAATRILLQRLGAALRRRERHCRRGAVPGHALRGPARHITARSSERSEQSVSRTGILLPMTDATGSIWMLDNVDR